MSAIGSDSEPARSLADLAPGSTAVVGELRFDEVDAVRLMELGFIPAHERDLPEESSAGRHLGLPARWLPDRNPRGDGLADPRPTAGRNGIRRCRARLRPLKPSPRLEGAALRTVAICGPPNVGKSTFFNRLTGLHQKVANYPGITVEKRIGRLELGNGQPVDLIDLPGIVGLHPRSEDERIAVEVLRGTSRTTPQPAAAILLLDSTNLEAQLRLVPEILGCGVPTLVALNMADDLAARGGSRRRGGSCQAGRGAGRRRKRPTRYRHGQGH